MHEMRVERQNQVVKMIMEKLRENDKREVQIEPKDQRNFKPDIVIKSKDKSRAWILDPTIRMEVSDEEITSKNTEKAEKYAPTADEIKLERFRQVTVHGLWMGARGVLSKDSINIFKSLGLDKEFIRKIVCLVLKLSHAMYKMFLR